MNGGGGGSVSAWFWHSPLFSTVICRIMFPFVQSVKVGVPGALPARRTSTASGLVVGKGAAGHGAGVQGGACKGAQAHDLSGMMSVHSKLTVAPEHDQACRVEAGDGGIADAAHSASGRHVVQATDNGGIAAERGPGGDTGDGTCRAKAAHVHKSTRSPAAQGCWCLVVGASGMCAAGRQAGIERRWEGGRATHRRWRPG